jgi:hypothetical protein
MQRREFVCYVVERGLVIASGATACSAAGCGTFIHSERCGQPHSGHLDWKIVALDGLGLLLFFVPGVVAFVVDFCTGAIFLPMHEAYPGYGCGTAPPGVPVLPPTYSGPPQPTLEAPPILVPARPGGQERGQELGLLRVTVPREQLERERIEQIATAHVGRPVSLGEAARCSELARIDDFAQQAEHHRSDREFGWGIGAFFERLARA